MDYAEFKTSIPQHYYAYINDIDEFEAIMNSIKVLNLNKLYKD